MPQSRTKYEHFQSASLSQKMSFKVLFNGKTIYPILAGSDPATSLKIGRMTVLRAYGQLPMLSDPAYNFIMDLLNMERMAKFATSQQVNEISKMGMHDPKEDDTYGEEPQ